MSDLGAARAFRGRPIRVAAIVLALAVALAIGVVLVLRPNLTGITPPQIPAFLDSENAAVRAALAGADSNEAMMEALAATIVAEYPAADDLWSTDSTKFETPAARELWDDDRQISFGSSHPPFSVPEDPSWAEDPYGDKTWQGDYHSLSWLLVPARAYAETGDPRYQQQVKRYLLDWIRDNPRGRAPSAQAWFDGAVGYRTDLMVALFKPVLADVMDGDDLSLFLESLRAHGRALRNYLKLEGMAGHNHNLFHALQLYNLSVAFPELRGANAWRQAARERVSTLMPEMVAVDEGVSLEQAASYHLLAMQLFARADAYLTRVDRGLTADERQTLESMAGFAALMVTPNGELPAIGDTPYGADGTRRLAALREAGISHPYADYVLTHGREGEEPPEANFFPESGYAILRPSYSRGPAWSRDLQLVVDTSPRERVHGHHDVMNVLLTAFGHSLLVDSGGPYAYGSPEREAFVGARAHNVVVVDDGLAEPGPVTDLVETDAADHSVVAGRYQVAPGVFDQRTVVLVKPDLVVVVDRLQATDSEDHQYRLLYHLPPDADVANDGTAGVVRAGSAGMGYRVIASGAATTDVITGQEEPLLGWVTDGHKRRTPAPTLSVAQTDRAAWYVTVLAPSNADDARAPRVRVRESATSLDVSVIRDGRTQRLQIRVDGTVRLDPA